MSVNCLCWFLKAFCGVCPFLNSVSSSLLEHDRIKYKSHFLVGNCVVHNLEGCTKVWKGSIYKDGFIQSMVNEIVAVTTRHCL